MELQKLLTELNRALPTIEEIRDQDLTDKAHALIGSVSTTVHGNGPENWHWQEHCTDSYCSLYVHHPKLGKILILSCGSNHIWNWVQYLGRGYNFPQLKLPNGHLRIGQYSDFKKGFEQAVLIAKIKWGKITAESIASDKQRNSAQHRINRKYFNDTDYTITLEKIVINNLRGSFPWG